jgi:integrase
MGDRIKPDYITQRFDKVLKKHGLRKVRFHDLRHSCASLLLANGVSMKEIQDWLGHSTFKTTADIYAHLSYDSKLASANALNIGTAFGKLTQSASESVSTVPSN